MRKQKRQKGGRTSKMRSKIYERHPFEVLSLFIYIYSMRKNQNGYKEKLIHFCHGFCVSIDVSIASFSGGSSSDDLCPLYFLSLHLNNIL